MTTNEAYAQGYHQAKAECLKLLAKWFFTPPGSDARECRMEMQKLEPQQLK